MNSDVKKILSSFGYPFIFLMLLWSIKISEIIFKVDFSSYGVVPLKINGLPGIITAPLIHGDIRHLTANSIPLFFLGSCLVFFYKELSSRVFFLIYLITGVWVWFFARSGCHIGASGIVYGLASFLFLSGVLRREPKVMAVSMLVIFLYGSMVWGVFPELFPEMNISWESHLMGIIAGFVLAIYYKKQGPQRVKYDWDDEEDEEEEESE